MIHLEKNEFKKLKNVQFHDNAVSRKNSDLIIIHRMEEFKSLDLKNFKIKSYNFMIYEICIPPEQMKIKGLNIFSRQK